MDLALIASCALLGLAGTPHCAAMCGAPCTAATVTRSGASLAFHAARATGYAAAGGLAAAGVGAAAWLAGAAPVLRPFWALLHMAALAVGLWMAATGRQPQWMTRIGRRPPQPGRWQPVSGPGQVAAAGAAGAMWVGWPCGLLQSALVVAALCNSPAGGATAMLAFGLASAPGLVAFPRMIRRLDRAGAGPQARGVSWALRASGAALVAGSIFALNRDWWGRLLALCGL
jgi:sulfite exporter TauE/SafE